MLLFQWNWYLIVGLIGLALLICACVVFFLLRSARRKGKTGEREGDPDALLAAGIQRNAAEFDGLYESLYQADKLTEAFSTDAFEEWCDRVEQLAGEPQFAAAFRSGFRKSDLENEAKGRKKIRELLRIIEKAGVVRHAGARTACRADETVRNAYFCADGSKPKIDVQYTIIKSAWILGNKVIEYGMVIPITSE